MHAHRKLTLWCDLPSCLSDGNKVDNWIMPSTSEYMEIEKVLCIADSSVDWCSYSRELLKSRYDTECYSWIYILRNYHPGPYRTHTKMLIFLFLLRYNPSMWLFLGERWGKMWVMEKLKVLDRCTHCSNYEYLNKLFSKMSNSNKKQNQLCLHS